MKEINIINSLYRNKEYIEAKALVNQVIEPNKLANKALDRYELELIRAEINFQLRKYQEGLNNLDHLYKRLKGVAPTYSKPKTFLGYSLGSPKPDQKEEKKIVELQMRFLVLKATLLYKLARPKESKEYYDILLRDAKYLKKEKWQLLDEQFDLYIIDLTERYQAEVILSDLADSEYLSEVDKAASYAEKELIELFEILGKNIPEATQDRLLRIEHAKNSFLEMEKTTQLPESSIKTVEQKQEVESSKNEKLGRKVFTALKVSFYNLFCDPDNRISGDVITKDKIQTIIISSLTSLGITNHSILAPVVAIVVVFGIDVFCNLFQ